MTISPLYDSGSLPRLLYFADTPIEDHMAFSTVYRVLEAYPKNKLLIIEGSVASDPDRRIAGVMYLQFKSVWVRLLLTPLASISVAPSDLLLAVPRKCAGETCLGFPARGGDYDALGLRLGDRSRICRTRQATIASHRP
jgi:hypothetical protein